MSSFLSGDSSVLGVWALAFFLWGWEKSGYLEVLVELKALGSTLDAWRKLPENEDGMQPG